MPVSHVQVLTTKNTNQVKSIHALQLFHTKKTCVQHLTLSQLITTKKHEDFRIVMFLRLPTNNERIDMKDAYCKKLLTRRKAVS